MPTFETPEPIAVAVDVLSGDVTVIASDRTDTVVEVRPADESESDDVRAAGQVLIGFAAGNLTVKTPTQWRTYTPFGGNPSIRVTIELPAGSRLKGTASVGRFRCTGELGRCDLKLSAGDVTLERPAGSVTAKTGNGDIRVDDASRGVLRLETSLGELEVGIRPGCTAWLQARAKHGTVQNLMAPASQPEEDADTVQVHARNSFGNIIIRHATAVSRA